jgi:exonuclease III
MNNTTADTKQGPGITGNGRVHDTLVPMTPCTIPHTYRIITLNINAIAKPNRLSMLAELLHRHDVDIAFLQEVTDGDFVAVKGYYSVVNVGTLGRGTSILHKPTLPLHNPKRLPSGRGIAVYMDNLSLVNICAPSGSANRAEREFLFNTEVVELFPHSPTRLILGAF